MRQATFDLPDIDHDRARSLIALVDQHFARESAAPPDAWRDLVALLALEKAVETRECAQCGRLARATATRCGYCWHVFGATP